MLAARLDRPTSAFLLAAAAVLALRLIALAVSPLELQFDEAQYWYWSRTLDWGYFSKPPLVAWAIAATTAVFGNAEWAVRLSAPFAQTVAAIALFLLARRMYGPWAGFWAGVGWLLMPAIWLSSAVMSTDALLMPLWAVALYALWRLHESGRWAWAIALGAAIGLGALAKYAMLYFVACAALAALWEPALRKTLVSARGGAALAITAFVLAPNLAWNAANSFATISHTAANSGLSRFGLHPDELIEFVLGQALVMGPILIVALAITIGRALAARSALDVRDRLLISFVAPPLAVILVQSLVSHAHANWAATAYPAAIVWLSGRFMQSARGRFVLSAATLSHVAIGLFMMAAMISPSFANAAGLGNAIEDSRGWRVTARETAERARALGPFTAVMVDHRALFFELTYYWRRTEEAGLPPLRMWLLRADPHNHAEAVSPMQPSDGARVLIVHAQERYVPFVAGDFARFREVDALEISLGGGETRPLQFSIGEGFASAPRDAAFLARIGD